MFQVVGNLFVLQILRMRLINTAKLVRGESQEAVPIPVIGSHLPSTTEHPK